jgi:predicted AAA+ superfamily ATPase
VDLDVLAVAETWSYWDRPVPASVPRSVALPEEFRPSVCLVVQGVRRAGKSTLLQQLLTRYELDPRFCAFLNLEDPRLSNALSYEVLERLVEQFRARHPDARRRVYFLDEVQAVEGWERWLRAKLDRPDGSVFIVSGSNASLLSGEMASLLTGRHLTVELFPFDLGEARQLDPEITLEQYLDSGGFPEPLQAEDGDRLRRQYFHDIIERDVRERLAARSSRPIRQVVQMAYETAGSELSLRRIAGAAGVAVETASGYLDACEDAYVLFGVPYFAFSERKRTHRNKKYYPVDTGLRRVVVTPTGKDHGKALECAVFLELRRRFELVSYWRGRGEVDFVVQDGPSVIPIQVTWDGPSPRHEAALQEFYETFPQAEEAVIVTRDRFDELLPV